ETVQPRCDIEENRDGWESVAPGNQILEELSNLIAPAGGAHMEEGNGLAPVGSRLWESTHYHIEHLILQTAAM
ncbi:hypothetical protein NY486_07005, partial [Enterobacter hormaechei]|nr:hypothetical protein [Enterobacter hormaechei]